MDLYIGENEMKTVKSFETHRFLVSIQESPIGKYIVITDTGLDYISQTLPLDDYQIASYIFDAAIEALQGQ